MCATCLWHNWSHSCLFFCLLIAVTIVILTQTAMHDKEKFWSHDISFLMAKIQDPATRRKQHHGSMMSENEVPNQYHVTNAMFLHYLYFFWSSNRDLYLHQANPSLFKKFYSFCTSFLLRFIHYTGLTRNKVRIWAWLKHTRCPRSPGFTVKKGCTIAIQKKLLLSKVTER